MRVGATDLRTFVAKKAHEAENKNCPKVRLYNCSAYMINADDVIVLKSFDTYVAHYDKNTHSIIAYETYSNITSQHIHKFERYIKEHYQWVSTIYPYFRGDSIVVRNATMSMSWKLDRGVYKNQRGKREEDASMRKWLIDTDFRILCDMPESLVDEYVLVSANYDEHERYVREYYGMTRW